MSKVLDKFLAELREAKWARNLPDHITRENVNRPVLTRHNWNERLMTKASRSGKKDVILALIDLGAVVSAETISESDASIFHWLVHYHSCYDNEKNKCMYQQGELRLLFEYKSIRTAKKLLYDEQHTYADGLQHMMQLREQNCRKALLTFIWVGKQEGYQSLRPLFVAWAKQFWYMKPYTDDLEPSVGPRSPVWDLREFADLSQPKKRLRK